jgi:hypothetical protein
MEPVADADGQLERVSVADEVAIADPLFAAVADGVTAALLAPGDGLPAGTASHGRTSCAATPLAVTQNAEMLRFATGEPPTREDITTSTECVSLEPKPVHLEPGAASGMSPASAVTRSTTANREPAAPVELRMTATNTMGRMRPCTHEHADVPLKT